VWLQAYKLRVRGFERVKLTSHGGIVADSCHATCGSRGDGLGNINSEAVVFGRQRKDIGQDAGQVEEVVEYGVLFSAANKIE